MCVHRLSLTLLPKCPLHFQLSLGGAVLLLLLLFFGGGFTVGPVQEVLRERYSLKGGSVSTSWKFEVWNFVISSFFNRNFNFEHLEISFRLSKVQIKGLLCCLSNRGENVSMGPFQGNRKWVYYRPKFNLGGPNGLLGLSSFSGMLKVVLCEPSFRDQTQEWVEGQGLGP